MESSIPVYSPTGALLVRAIDILLAAGALAIAAPFMLVIAIMIRLDSGPPIFFCQIRAGHNSDTVRIHKFRTLLASTPDHIVTPEGDPNVTRCGRVLRRYRLDELPQLIDVLAGRLALVGPRPELAEDLAAVPASTRERFLAIKPGLTGPVQLAFIEEDALLALCGDPTYSYQHVLVPAKVDSNLRAFQARSIWRDLGCLLKTVWVLGSRSARVQSREQIRVFLRDQSTADQGRWR